LEIFDFENPAVRIFIYVTLTHLLIATGNPGKFKEISKVLEGTSLSIYSHKDLSIDTTKFVEDEETLADNAYKKAVYSANKSGMITLADDS
jgi:XTP/dITP diphosphohydrolase